MEIEIKLEKEAWTFDDTERLGPPGGFGEVFRGLGNTGEVAVKRLNLTAAEAAHRELTIGRSLHGRNLDHVVPILDYGQDANSDRYYLVMPICSGSLQDELSKVGKLGWPDAKPVILAVISGLLEVGDIVHRDLKPGNVLRHDGKWKVADFGIAKFVEESTSLETLRRALTPSYAAPEQWRLEAPTRATDVYALGCVAHVLISGKPPFSGDVDQLRAAHLGSTPAPLPDVDPRFSSLVLSMLRKSAASRPSLERCRDVIAGIEANPLRQRNSALAEIGRALTEKEAADDAARATAQAAERERAAMADEAIGELRQILIQLFEEIETASSAARRETQSITLGAANLSFTSFIKVSNSGPRGARAWDIIAASTLMLRCSIERMSMGDPSVYTYSTNLVFATTPRDRDYRWREVGFFNFLHSGRNDHVPSALSPEGEDFNAALSNVIGSWQTACGPWTIDGEDHEDFIERWLKLFTKAAQGRLRPPNALPLQPHFFQL